MSRFKTTDYLLEVAKGNVAGSYAVNKFGSSSFIDTTPTPVWDRDSAWLAPTVASVHTIVGSATDTIAGVGAQKVTVYYLADWDTAEASIELDMNGAGGVATPSCVMIHRMVVTQTGSSAFPNDGDITAETTGEPVTQTITAQIAAIKGQTQMAIWGIPSTQKFYMYNFGASIAHSSPGPVGADAAGIIILAATDITTNTLAYTFKHTASIQDNGSTSMDRIFSPPKLFEGPTIIKVDMVAAADPSFCDASFDGVLVNN